MIGRAQALLKYAAETEMLGKTEDDLAYRRPENHYYNNLIIVLRLRMNLNLNKTNSNKS